MRGPQCINTNLRNIREDTREMATAQQVRTSQDTQLAPNQVVTEQQSLVVIKKLLAIAVSGITYLRGIFPARAYGKKYVEDQKVMILREDHSCPGAVQILHWMQGCFEAIQKKYLRKVIMSISADPENPQKVTEVYQFKIQYTTGGALIDFESNNHSQVSMSSGNTKKASILLVRKLYTLMQNLGPLPDNFCLNMKLAYYDDVTPADYQPPGFKEAESGAMQFELEPLRMAIGEVATPFHWLKLDMTTERHRLDQVNASGAAAEQWVMEVGEEEEEDSMKSHVSEAVEAADSVKTDLQNAQIQDVQMFTETQMKYKETEAAVTRTSEVEHGVMRTRSGRIVKTTAVSGFHVPNSQEADGSVSKRRKLSEPKKRDV